jgi:hypothetical protein
VFRRKKYIKVNHWNEAAMKQETPRYKVISIKKFSENITLQKGY